MKDPRGFGHSSTDPLDPFELNWKDGPLPPDTWNWGGVVTRDMDTPGSDCGFRFADFRGDHVITDQYTTFEKRYEAADILKWNNSLHLPPSF
jgi:hypothetical protein